jgi:uncharacterized membrane protein
MKYFAIFFTGTNFKIFYLSENYLSQNRVAELTNEFNLNSYKATLPPLSHIMPINEIFSNVFLQKLISNFF